MSFLLGWTKKTKKRKKSLPQRKKRKKYFLLLLLLLLLLGQMTRDMKTLYAHPSGCRSGMSGGIHKAQAGITAGGMRGGISGAIPTKTAGTRSTTAGSGAPL